MKYWEIVWLLLAIPFFVLLIRVHSMLSYVFKHFSKLLSADKYKRWYLDCYKCGLELEEVYFVRGYTPENRCVRCLSDDCEYTDENLE